MGTLKINFNTPLPNNQQSPVMKNLKELGFSTERVFQNGKYIKWHYQGRLPTTENNDSVFIKVLDPELKIEQFKKITHVEFYLYFERKN